jgi:MoxR-like ATPase
MVEELRGVMGLKAGSTRFVPGIVTSSIMDRGWFLFDEPNLCRPSVLGWLNTVLDDGGELVIPETGVSIPVPSAWRTILCMNEGYNGTRELNQAMRDRCRVIQCDYWSEEDEYRLLRSHLPDPPFAKSDLQLVIRVANGIREARRKGSTDFDFSPRTMIMWLKDADVRTQDLVRSFREVVLPKVGDPALKAAEHEAFLEIARLVLG